MNPEAIEPQKCEHCDFPVPADDPTLVVVAGRVFCSLICCDMEVL